MHNGLQSYHSVYERKVYEAEDEVHEHIPAHSYKHYLEGEVKVKHGQHARNQNLQICLHIYSGLLGSYCFSLQNFPTFNPQSCRLTILLLPCSYTGSDDVHVHKGLAIMSTYMHDTCTHKQSNSHIVPNRQGDT